MSSILQVIFFAEAWLFLFLGRTSIAKIILEHKVPTVPVSLQFFEVNINLFILPITVIPIVGSFFIVIHSTAEFQELFHISLQLF